MTGPCADGGMETVAGSIDNMLINLITRGGMFNARIYEGTPQKFLRAKRIVDCFIQIDNPDRDWENRSQILLFTGTLFFHYFGGANPDGTSAGANAPIAILPFSELEFIKAEGTFIKSGAAAAQPIYQQAIRNNMEKLGLDLTSAPVTNYLAARGTLTNDNALQRIMEEKSIADLLSVENFNDWRRTGFPVLTIVDDPEAGITSIPRKYQYSQQEISSNPQPENTNSKITDRVWWDQ